MAIVFEVEDGTGLVNANAYAEVADVTQYHENNGNAAWAAASLDQQQVAIIKGTQYIDAMYRARDRKFNAQQALQFPSWSQDWPSTHLVHATAELALRALAGGLINDTDGRVQDSIKVGPIAIGYKGGFAQSRYTVVDALMSSLIGGTATSVRVHRA